MQRGVELEDRSHFFVLIPVSWFLPPNKKYTKYFCFLNLVLELTIMTPEQAAEINKLSHILGEEKGEKLRFLERLSYEELEFLRIKIQDSAHEEQAKLWKKLPKVASFMPNFVNAKVAEQVLGASITANISYYIDLRDAISIMKFLSLPFMAEVAHYMIPEKSVPLLNNLPIDMMKKLVAYLLRKDEHFVVGTFVEVTDSQRVIEISKSIEKEDDLIKISKYVKNKSSLVAVFRSFNDYRKVKLFKEAHRLNSFEVAIDMAMLLSGTEIEKLTALLFKESPQLMQQFVDASVARHNRKD